MTSLKDLDKTVKVGNKNIEKLNDNFGKWFELQKRNRLDDLENAREMKRALKGSTTVATATGAGASNGSEIKNWIFKMRGWIWGAIGVVLIILLVEAVSWGGLGVEKYTNFFQTFGTALLSVRLPTDPDLSKGNAIFYTLIFLIFGTAASQRKPDWTTTVAFLSILLYLFFRL